MEMKTRITAAGLAAVTIASILTSPLLAAPAPIPDLTQGGKRDRKHDWTLGPTGARGWMWGRGMETTAARQILITKVDKGSPADGVLEVGDVILGVGGKPFDSDPRRALGQAIAEAEKAKNKGRLRLIRWRKGTKEAVVVGLKVMGSYSHTAPLDCPKSKRILEQGCRSLAARKLDNSIVGQLNALALLASGRLEYLDHVKKLAHKTGRRELKLKLAVGMFAWEWGYANLFLTEYYLATGDEFVLPAIREYSKTIATGQSAVGTWGHGMSLPGDDGRLGGYGAINSAGLVCWMSMALAQKCGIRDAVVNRAVGRSHAFFRFYTGKGSIPYGDHPPFWDYHSNNGKNAMAAVAFDLLGDRKSTRFFARMTTASYDEREYGHTGNFFSYAWGPLGAFRVGDEAVAAFLKEQRWYYDLARRWDGRFIYQGGAGESDSYRNWDMTGAILLTYALPLRKLHITGKGIRRANRLTATQVRSTIADGRGFTYRAHRKTYDNESVEQLLKRLASWSPTVRYRAATSLAKKQGDFVPKLIAMLRSSSPHARLGACQALEYLGERAAPATDALAKLIPHKDVWLRIRAIYALAGIGRPASKTTPALLELALKTDSGDPLGMTRRYLCMALFKNGYLDNGPRRGLLADSLTGVDRKLLVPTIKRMLKLSDGYSRSTVASVYGKLTDEELDQLWPDIFEAVVEPAPSGEMFADGVRLAGLKLLAKHHVKEGIRACLGYARDQNPWASENRMWTIMTVLKSYGAAAQAVLPELRKLATYCKNEKDFPENCRKKKTAAVEDAIKAIEAATDQPKLRSIARLLRKAEP
jgi:hypothetical protein